MSLPTPSQLLWEACGSPASHKASALPEGRDGDWTRCWVCAGETRGRGCPIAAWDGANFTGQTRVKCPRAQAICEACLWVMARHSPVPDKTGNWRNYSVLYAHGEPVTIASKGEKPTILAWLRRPHASPWFAALADTGQKHVVPYVPVNGRGPARALFDEVPIDLPRDPEGWRIVDDLVALLTAGATKEEVERGDYTLSTMMRCEADVRAFEARYAHQRGSGWFAIVVFLAQRDEEAVTARMAREAEARAAKKVRAKAAAKIGSKTKRAAVVRVTKDEVQGGRDSEDAEGRRDRGGEGAHERRDGRRAPRAARAVPRDGGERAQALGSDRGGDEERGATVERTGGVGLDDGYAAPPGGADERPLRGDRGARGGGAAVRRPRVARARGV